jgi:DNA-binding HxlR family transcriptional regulator
MKELESRGIVARHVSHDTPVRVCYELTEKGRQLAPALGELKTWADRWLNAP